MKSGFQRAILSLALAFALAFSLVLSPGMAWQEAAAADETLSTLMCEAWDNCEAHLDVTGMGLTEDNYLETIYNIFYDTPQCFHLKSFGATLESRVTKKIKTLNFEYTVSAEEYQTQLAAYNARVADAVSVIDSSWSEVEIALYLHDWIAANSQYDLNYEAYDAYQLLVNGVGVCQGSAAAFLALGRAAGLETHMLTTDELVHAWNIVKIDGQWYHLDVSNDDSSPDKIGNALHKFFLKSDAVMMADSNHAASDWKIHGEHDEITCDSTKYDSFFWNNCSDTFEWCGNGWFVVQDDTPEDLTSADQIAGGCYLYQYDATTGTFVPTLLRTVKDTWKVWDKPTNVYTAFLGLGGVYGDKLYYSTSTEIYQMELDGSNATVLYQLSAAEQEAGRIYGLNISPDGLLHYMVRPRVSASDGEVISTIVLGDVPQTTTTTPVTTTTTQETTTTTTTTTSTTTTVLTTTTKRTTTTPITTTTTTRRTTTMPVTTTTTRRTTTMPVTTTTTRRTTTTPVTTTTTIIKETTTTPITTTTARRTKPTTTPDTTITTTVTTATTNGTAPTTTSTTETTTTTAVSQQMYGDINQDGVISIADVVRLARFISQDETLDPPMTAQDKNNADCLLDGSVDAQDVAQLCRFLAGLGGMPSTISHARS